MRDFVAAITSGVASVVCHVGRAIKQPSQAARQRYNFKTIPKRIKTLGVVGVIRLWVVKLGIVLNVQGIQRWYNGGFRAAPRWYSNHAGFYP